LNKRTPKHIIYFRDGVSDSQYKSIRDLEVNKIKRVLQDQFKATVNVTAVVVTKRHHTRFYQTGNAKDLANTPPGKRIVGEMSEKAVLTTAI
jgi:eukaryotic translation initiation factor 2C